MGEWKTDCKVGGHDGTAHIVEREYDARFKVWYGCVDIVCDTEEVGEVARVGDRLSNRVVLMELADGRVMSVHIQNYEVRQQSLPEGGAGPRNHLGCYFVSVTPLGGLTGPRDVYELLPPSS
jgi:hypothetical protein